ncbi:MAG: L,D-transpeptidase family protein [Verrucomicrobiota bacterium]
MIKRLLLYGALFLLMSMAAWYWQKTPESCETCLPMPDLKSLFMPPPPIPLPYPMPPTPGVWDAWPATQRLADVNQRVLPVLKGELQKRELELGADVYLRAFKQERELELWLRSGTGWHLWRTYPVASASGYAGPKQREGDYQVPEGFYEVTLKQMNPGSSYHLAFNIGYPNAYDLQHQRTGSFIMIHGRDVSVGCLAMRDPVIEEIYLLMQATLEKGQSKVPVHLFPFRMTDENMNSVGGHPAEAFWSNELRPAWQHFEDKHEVPEIGIVDGQYQLRL